MHAAAVAVIKIDVQTVHVYTSIAVCCVYTLHAVFFLIWWALRSSVVGSKRERFVCGLAHLLWYFISFAKNMEVERKKSVRVFEFFFGFGERKKSGRDQECARANETDSKGKKAELLHAHVCVFDTVNERGPNHPTNQQQKKHVINVPRTLCWTMSEYIWIWWYDSIRKHSCCCRCCCVSATGSNEMASANMPKCDVIIIDREEKNSMNRVSVAAPNFGTLTHLHARTKKWKTAERISTSPLKKM